MSASSDRVSRGARVVEIQALVGYENDNIGFAERLNGAARELGLPAVWHATRLSKIRSGMQDLSINDMAVIARLDPKARGWTYPAYGIAITRGDDAWTVLAREAKRSHRSA